MDYEAPKDLDFMYMVPEKSWNTKAMCVFMTQFIRQSENRKPIEKVTGHQGFVDVED